MTELFTTKLESPIGELQVAATKYGLCFLEFNDDDNNNLFGPENVWTAEYKIIEDSNYPLFIELKSQLSDYFEKKRTEFDIPFDFVGTDFQKRVWNELLTIEFGKTRTYLDQSKALGDVKAIRAVASANGRNKIAIVVPCHRVIGSDGSLTGYAGKLWRKKFLLELESNQASLF